MDLKPLISEDFNKKSNKYLLDLVNQLDVENRAITKEIEKHLDRQDLLFAIYNRAMDAISSRSGN